MIEMRHIPAGKKMVVFDMDNTLLLGRFIDTCADKYNFKHALNLLRQIDKVPVSLTKRIAAFLEGKTVEELIRTAEMIPMVEDIVEVSNILKQRGYIIGIISDSYRLITDHIGKKINADFTMANELIVKDGVATGELIIPRYFFPDNESRCAHQVCKLNALQHICRTLEIPVKKCIVVGDSEADRCMIEHAGIGMAFCSSSEMLIRAAHRRIDTPAFKELLEFAP